MMRSTYAELSLLWNEPAGGTRNPRTAGYRIAVNRVAEAYRAMGL